MRKRKSMAIEMIVTYWRNREKIEYHPINLKKSLSSGVLEIKVDGGVSWLRSRTLASGFAF